jgi:cytochrome c-type biogenesis protein CcmH/NrfF
MRKVIIFTGLMAILLVPMVAAAVEKAPRITDCEIVERLTRLEEGQKALNERIDGLEKSLNTRIDDLRAEMNGRIDDLRAEMNGRIDDLRAEMNGRFQAMDKRFDTLQRMLWLFITISLVILGFVLRMQWQMQRRQTGLEATLNAHKDELAFLKNLIEKLLPPKEVL